MVNREPWSVAKVDHGRTPRLYHSQPWSTMVDNEKPWYHGQSVAGVWKISVFYFQNKVVYQAEDRPADICLKFTSTWWR